MDKDGYPTPFIGRTGQRVYWHGIFPQFNKQGTIKATGLIRHEVLWDGDQEPSLVYVNALQSVKAAPKCCAYCISWSQR